MGCQAHFQQRQLTSPIHPIAPQLVWFQRDVVHFGSNCVLKATYNLEYKSNTTSHGKWPARHGSVPPGSTLPASTHLCPTSAPANVFLWAEVFASLPLFKASRGTTPPNPAILCHPSSEQAPTAAISSPSLLNWAPCPHSLPRHGWGNARNHILHFGNIRGLAVSCQIHARKSLSSFLPSLSPNLFFHYPSLHIMELIKDIFTLLGLGLNSNYKF